MLKFDLGSGSVYGNVFNRSQEREVCSTTVSLLYNMTMQRSIIEPSHTHINLIEPVFACFEL